MRVPVEIKDNSTGEPVQALLFDAITIEHFIETQKEWRPIVVVATRKLAASKLATGGYVPAHFHWDWTSKEAQLKLLAIHFYGIEHLGKLQGIMKVESVGHVCRLPMQQGKPLIYIDYLEVAPWNVKLIMEALGKPTKYGAVGTRLIEAAVRQSIEEGFKGRVALHSLSTSERFYREVCKMTPVGRDSGKQNLLWCEFTPEQAQDFLGG
ncbi:MAG: GNAT family N-acetyltransferase [Terriglobia bacterium]